MQSLFYYPYFTNEVLERLASHVARLIMICNMVPSFYTYPPPLNLNASKRFLEIRMKQLLPMIVRTEKSSEQAKIPCLKGRLSNYIVILKGTM